MTTQPYRIYLLGQFSLQRPDKTLHSFRTRKAGVLLAHLACFGERRHSREQLTEMLWPDAAPDAARQNFRQALSTLRACLEPDPSLRGSVLVSDHSHVALNPEAVRVDTRDFENALRRARRETDSDRQAAHLADAVALYRGELLPGHYEEWALSERARLHSACVSALEQWGQWEEARQNWTGALACALRVMQGDPYHEAAHTAAIRCYLQTGQRARALACYEEFALRLRQELDAAPPPALLALLASEDTSPAPAGRAQMPAAFAGPAERQDVQPGAKPRKNAAASIVNAPPAASNETRPDTAPLPSPAPLAPALHTAAPGMAAPCLPTFLTAFFGREEESWRVGEMLGHARLVTLTGPGGCGKTRLAVETGRLLRADYHDAVYFAGLADIPRATGIAPCVADALCRAHADLFTSSPSPDALEQIVGCLQSSPALLILDNYEHLAEEGAAFVVELLHRCPRLTCLLTSRRRLNVSGERVLPLRPLSVPNLNDGMEILRDNAAVQLFLDRAQAARPDFHLTRYNAPLLAGICAGLEGLPLALELAAARIGTFSLAEMRRQIEHEDGGSRLLVSRHRDTRHRHHNLNATIEWSFCLLPSRAQEFFTRLSLLHGTWTANAAQAVTNDADAADTLEVLCQASLVISVEAGDTAGGEDAPARFRLLEMLRQFGARRLTGRARAEAAHRHAAHYLEQAQANAPGGGIPESAWIARMQQDMPNARAALDWCFSPDGAQTAGVDLCLALEAFWRRRGPFQEAHRCFSRALAAPVSDTDLTRKAAILHAVARFASLLGESGQATALGRECVRLQRGLTDKRLLAQALYRLGHYLWVEKNSADAETAHHEALALYKRLNDAQGMGNVLNSLGTLAVTRGDLEEAERCWTQNLTFSRAARDDIGAGSALCNLSFIAIDAEDWHGALRLLHECILLFERACDARWTASAHGMAARVYDSMSEHDRAESHYQTALAGYNNMGDQEGMAVLWLARARACLCRHDTPAAKRWLHQSMETLLPSVQRSGVSDGLAVWVYEFAFAAYGEGHAARGIRLQSFAQTALARTGERPFPSVQKRLDHLESLARAQVGEEAYTRYRREGQTLSWQEAIGLALTF